MKATSHGAPILPEEEEEQALRALESLLSQRDASFRIVGAQGAQAVLPESAVTLLRQIAHDLAQHKQVAIVPVSHALTTQEAADLLNVSRPYLIRLLDQGAMPFTKTGAHRRIALDDVLRYKAQRDAERKRTLDELSQLNQEIGLYDA